MPLMRFFGEERIKVLFWEIESSIEIKLKTISQQLISKTQLEECLNTRNKKRSVIVITVGSKKDILKLCAKRFRFGEAPKFVEKYCKAGPSLICMTYLKISHNQLGWCNQKLKQCIIYVGAHKSKNYKCKVIECIVKRGKIRVYVISKCSNCWSNHQETAFRCLVK